MPADLARPALPWDLPAELQRKLVSVHGAPGRAWLDDLPATCAALAERWMLEAGPLLPGLSYHLVCEARLWDGHPAVLKLGPPSAEIEREIAALFAYDGRPAPRLLAADAERGALLLERLEPGSTLAQTIGPAGEGDAAATAIAADLMAGLWHAPLDASPFPRVADWGRGFARMRQRFEGGSGPLPADLADRAEALFAELLASADAPVLLHGDLHHHNILDTADGWKAIDPKGVLGEPAYEPGALLRNPWAEMASWPRPEAVLDRRLDILSERLGLDRQRILGWGIAQAGLSAWWSVEDGAGDGGFSMAVAGWLSRLRGAP